MSNIGISAVGFAKLVATAADEWQIVEGNYDPQTIV